jgi:CHRD domain
MVVVSTNRMTDKLVLAQGALKKFTADLSGKSEVPPVDTKASGTAQFQISADGKQIDYECKGPEQHYDGPHSSRYIWLKWTAYRYVIHR